MKKTEKLSRSENMRRIKSKDTSIEIRLRKELWKRGLRYRKNVKLKFKTIFVSVKSLIPVLKFG